MKNEKELNLLVDELSAMLPQIQAALKAIDHLKDYDAFVGLCEVGAVLKSMVKEGYSYSIKERMAGD
jgi:hypothetical protein